MIINKVPLFVKGEVLDAEMLELLRDTPSEFFNLLQVDYSDGIISGINITVENGKIIIGKGLFKFRSKLYRINKNLLVEKPEVSGEYTLKLKISDNGVKYKKHEFLIETILETSNKVGEDELFIASFKIQDGTYLRANDGKFSEYSTEYNMLNIINQKHSCTHKDGTIAPIMLKSFARELVSKGLKDEIDTHFVFTCFNNNITREAILYYLTIKNEREFREMDNTEIYNELKYILYVGGGKGGFSGRKKKMPRILVD